MNITVRTASLISGCSLALMAVLAPIGVMVALPTGATGLAALIMLIVATLDVAIGVALYVVLQSGGTLLAATSSALRIAFAAVLAVAAGSLADPADVEPELTVLVPRTRAAELSQYLTHLSRYRGRNDMLHALDRDHPVLYPGKLLHKLLHRHTSRFLNMP